jgi:hypothetical protein
VYTAQALATGFTSREPGFQQHRVGFTVQVQGCQLAVGFTAQGLACLGLLLLLLLSSVVERLGSRLLCQMMMARTNLLQWKS